MERIQASSLELIGKWKFPAQKFIYEKSVFLKDTNATGNMYFARYVELQGEVREKFLMSHPASQQYLKSNPHIAMITHSVFHRFMKDSFFGDQIFIEMTTRDILDYSLGLVFRYLDKEGMFLIGEGWQKICFMDKQKKQLCLIPQLILDLAEPILQDGHGK